MSNKTLFDMDLTYDEAVELIKNGADVNKKDLLGSIPLHYTRDFEIAKLLIDNGADVNALDNVHRSVLHSHYQFIFNDLIKYLIDNGAILNIRNHQGHTIISFIFHSLGLVDDVAKKWIKHGEIASTIMSYQHFSKYFSEEQQKAFDAYASIASGNDDTFFQMCLAYQNSLKNHVKIEINEMNIL